MLLRLLVFLKIIPMLLPGIFATKGAEWHIFLDQLHCFLSSYQVQKNTTNFYVENVDKDFLKKIEKYKLIYRGNKNVDDLNAVLNVTLRSKPEIRCDNDELTIEGIFVKATDMPQIDRFCSQKVNMVKIFAVDTFFMDRYLDFKNDNELVVVIMAKKWVVDRDSVINLSGKTLSRLPNTFWFKQFSGERGNNGGTFYGLGDEFVGGDLRVISNGENGRNGRINFTIPELRGQYNNCQINNGGNGGHGGVVKIFALDNIQIESRAGNGGGGGLTLLDNNCADKNISYPYILFGPYYNPPECYCLGEKGKSGSPNRTLTNPTEAIKILNSYKAFLIKNYIDYPVISEIIYSFIEKIDNNPEVSNLYRMMDFVEEFEVIQPLTSSDSRKAAHLYKSLLNKIANSKCSSDEEKKLRLYLYTAVLSFICRLEEDSETGLITDLKSYLDIIMEHVKNVKASGDLVIVDGFANNYRRDFEQKTLEAEGLIAKHIQPKIEDITKKVGQEIEELVNEIDHLTKAARQDKKKLESKKLELATKIKCRLALGIIGGVLATVASMFGGGFLVGEVISIATKTGVEFLDTDIYTGYNPTRYNFSKAKEYEKDYSEVYQNNQATCNDRQKRDLKNVAEKAKKGFEKFAPDIVKNYNSDKGKSKILQEQIERVGEQIENLQDMKSRVCKVLGPVVDIMTKDLVAWHDSHRNKSETYILVRKWEVQKGLIKVKSIIADQFRGLGATNQIVVLLEELMDSIDILVQVFDNFQKYQQQKNLGSFISQVSSSKFEDVSIDDLELKQRVHKLDLLIKSNIVLLEYKRFSNAIRQYSFPFAHNYFKKFRVPTELSINETADDFTKRVLDKLLTFQEKIAKSQFSITKFDDIKHSDAIFGGKNGTDPFFVWTKVQYRREISDLLSGKEVVLRADPCFRKMREAIKFKDIGLKFKSREGEINLDDFSVEMVHTGISYFKCGSRTFMISSNVTSIVYQKIGGQLVDRNEVYSKLKMGNYLLSPYTTWRVKLEGGNFTRLKKFVGKVDLELVGVGEYYRPRPDLCSQNLELYYKVESGSVCGFGEREKYVVGHGQCRVTCEQ